jgi:hypothetical protein
LSYPRLLLWLLLVSLLALSRAEADEAKFWLRLTGSTFVNFAGNCDLVDQRGFATTTRLIGSVPQSYAISAEAVNCQIQNSGVDGTLIAELGATNAVIARASTAASFGEVLVRSDGPWGNARAAVNAYPWSRGSIIFPPCKDQGYRRPSCLL